MRYQIPDDVLPDSQPDKTFGPMALMLVFTLAGTGIGFFWAILNARWLGCPDVVNQRNRLIIYWIITVAMLLAARGLHASYDETALAYLLGTILNSLSFMMSLLGVVLVFDRQKILSTLQARRQTPSKGRYFKMGGIILAVLIVALFINDGSIMRTLLLAGSIWTAL